MVHVCQVTLSVTASPTVKTAQTNTIVVGFHHVLAHISALSCFRLSPCSYTSIICQGFCIKSFYSQNYVVHTYEWMDG